MIIQRVESFLEAISSTRISHSGTKRKGRATSSSSVRVHVPSGPLFFEAGGFEFSSSSRSHRK